jgi:hypothetical protein
MDRATRRETRYYQTRMHQVRWAPQVRSGKNDRLVDRRFAYHRCSQTRVQGHEGNCWSNSTIG